MSLIITTALWLAAFVVVGGGVAYMVDRRDRRRSTPGRFDDLKRRIERLEKDMRQMKKEDRP